MTATSQETGRSSRRQSTRAGPNMVVGKMHYARTRLADFGEQTIAEYLVAWTLHPRCRISRLLYRREPGRAMFGDPGRDLGSRREAELVEDMLHVGFGSSLCDHQLGCDRLVAQSFGH